MFSGFFRVDYLNDPTDLSDIFGRTVRTAGQCYIYSNIGYATLGQAVATHYETTYEELLSATILHPLDLTDTGLTVPASEVDRRVQGYLSSGELARGWTHSASAPAGAIKSTPHDMMKFLLAFLAANQTTDKQKMAAAMRLSTSQISLLEADGQTITMGLGWHVMPGESGKTVYWHNGGTDGFSTFMAIDLQSQRALFLVANQFKLTLDNQVDNRITESGLFLMQPQDVD